MTARTVPRPALEVAEHAGPAGRGMGARATRDGHIVIPLRGTILMLWFVLVVRGYEDGMNRIPHFQANGAANALIIGLWKSSHSQVFLNLD